MPGARAGTKSELTCLLDLWPAGWVAVSGRRNLSHDSESAVGQHAPSRIHFCRLITLLVAKCSRVGTFCSSQRSIAQASFFRLLNRVTRGTKGSRKFRSANFVNPYVTTATSSRVMGCSNSEISASGVPSHSRSEFMAREKRIGSRKIKRPPGRKTR